MAACRQIRRYAARGPGAAEGLFTFAIEIDSLFYLKKYQTAWRRLRRQEEVQFGQRLDHRHQRVTRDLSFQLSLSYAPVLYYLGRYRRGCQLLETSLGFWLDSQNPKSYDILYRVGNGEEEPTDRCRVTLSHFYGRLGKDLRKWRHWEAFVDGFHPRLFRLSGIDREALRRDAALLPPFFERLVDLRAQRVTSGIGGSLSDLIESPATVQKRRESLQQRRDEFEASIRPVQEETNRKLRELFPELRDLVR